MLRVVQGAAQWLVGKVAGHKLRDAWQIIQICVGQQGRPQACAHQLPHAGLILRSQEARTPERVQCPESGGPGIHVLKHGSLFWAVAGEAAGQLAELCCEAVLNVQSLGIAVA